MLVYKYHGPPVNCKKDELRTTKIWRPSAFSWLPVMRPIKYVLYTAFHYARVFKNRDYCAIFVGQGQEICASMLIVPAHFKWPFMASTDLQFIYGVTFSSARGKGWGTFMISEGLRLAAKEGRNIWAVISEENVPSQRMVEKNGFKLVGEAKRNRPRMPVLNIVNRYYDDDKV